MFEKLFKLEKLHTNIKTEVRGRIVTFMSMAYVIFVAPSILSETNMPFDSVLFATCLASALG